MNLSDKNLLNLLGLTKGSLGLGKGTGPSSPSSNQSQGSKNLASPHHLFSKLLRKSLETKEGSQNLISNEELHSSGQGIETEGLPQSTLTDAQGGLKSLLEQVISQQNNPPQEMPDVEAQVQKLPDFSPPPKAKDQLSFTKTLGSQLKGKGNIELPNPGSIELPNPGSIEFPNKGSIELPKELIFDTSFKNLSPQEKQVLAKVAQLLQEKAPTKQKAPLTTALSGSHDPTVAKSPSKNTQLPLEPIKPFASKELVTPSSNLNQKYFGMKQGSLQNKNPQNIQGSILKETTQSLRVSSLPKEHHGKTSWDPTNDPDLAVENPHLKQSSREQLWLNKQISKDMKSSAPTLKTMSKTIGKGSAVLEKSRSLALLSGETKSFTKESLTKTIAESPFIQKALSEDVPKFMAEKRPIHEFAEMFGLKKALNNSSEPLTSEDLKSQVSANQFLKSLGVDPQKVSYNLEKMQDQITEKGLNNYVKDFSLEKNIPAEDNKSKNQKALSQNNQSPDSTPSHKRPERLQKLSYVKNRVEAPVNQNSSEIPQDKADHPPLKDRTLSGNKDRQQPLPRTQKPIEKVKFNSQTEITVNHQAPNRKEEAPGVANHSTILQNHKSLEKPLRTMTSPESKIKDPLLETASKELPLEKNVSKEILSFKEGRLGRENKNQVLSTKDELIKNNETNEHNRFAKDKVARYFSSYDKQDLENQGLIKRSETPFSKVVSPEVKLDRRHKPLFKDSIQVKSRNHVSDLTQIDPLIRGEEANKQIETVSLERFSTTPISRRDLPEVEIPTTQPKEKNIMKGPDSSVTQNVSPLDLQTSDPITFTKNEAQPSQIKNQLFQETILLLGKGGGTSTLEFNDSDMGKIKFAIQLTGNHVDLQVQSETNDIRHLFGQDLLNLKEQLKTHNIELANIEYADLEPQAEDFSGQQQKGLAHNFDEKLYDEASQELRKMTEKSHIKIDPEIQTPIPMNQYAYPQLDGGRIQLRV